jgi:hypothetical protein
MAFMATYESGFQLSLFLFVFAGASPQAGMKRAVGAENRFGYDESVLP